MLLDDEAAAFVGRQDDTPLDVAANLAAGLGSGAAGYTGATRQLEVDGLTGVGITFADLGAEDVSAILTDGDSILDVVMIRQTGDVLRFDAVAEPELEDATERLVATAPTNIRDIVGMVLSVEIPGGLIDHNADRVTGSTLEWDLLPAVLDREAVRVFVEVAIPDGFVLLQTGDADSGPGIEPSIVGTNETTMAAWVWLVPTAVGLWVWIVLARRAASDQEKEA